MLIVRFVMSMAAAILLLGSTGAEKLYVPVGEFSEGRLDGWQSKAFKGKTDYRLVADEGRTVLRAVSEGQASGLYREMVIDLDQTPYLNWSWRVDGTLGRVNERSKGGDDYPARLYVIVGGGLAFWQTRSVNYVWSSAARQGDSWANAFAGDQVRMVAVRSGNRETGRWLREKRNVREDLQRFFGAAIHRIDAVAVMSDTDNSGGRAVAYYGDIFFTDE
jgi:hypothetical protein